MDLENSDTEWKESWKSEYLKTLAAFHNTDGGRMYVGRDDNGRFIGVKNPKNVAKVISDSIRNKLHIRSSVNIVEIDGETCIIIDIPKGDSCVDYDGRFYFRVGNTTQQIEGNDLKMILLEERGLQWLDQPSRAKIDDISADAISYFINKGKKAERIPESVDETDIEAILNRFELIQFGKPTVAAMILFSDQPSRYSYGACLKIGLFDPKESLLRDEIIEGPLISAPDRAIEALYQRFIPPTYRYDGKGAARYLKEDYPKEAVRELILNAIIHSDYSKGRDMTVALRDGRLEVSSGGELPEGLSLDTFPINHPSIKRNQRLANVFYAAGDVEAWGQGITKVMDECVKNGNPDPSFEYCCGNMIVTIPKIPEITVPTFLDGYGKKDIISEILNVIESRPESTAKSIADELGITDRTVRSYIAEMTNKGLIMRDGSKKTGRWIIINRNIQTKNDRV